MDKKWGNGSEGVAGGRPDLILSISFVTDASNSLNLCSQSTPAPVQEVTDSPPSQICMFRNLLPKLIAAASPG